jgi:hypothetical protein
MKLKKSKEIPMWAQTGHSKPITRREMLAHGLIPFAGSLLAPQFLNMILANTAEAQATAVCAAPTTGLVPFISLNLSGGAAMAANFVPMNASGTPIASYSKMGLGDNQVPIVREFGGGTFAGNNAGGVLISKMLAGIRLRADAATIANTTFVGVCVRSRDDSGENPFNISGLVTKAGLVGTHLPNLGARNSLTGVNQEPAVIAPPTPLVVSSFRDILNSLGYSAALGTQLSKPQKERLANLVSKLSASQVRKLASIKTGDQIQNLVECAGIKNSTLIQEGSGAVDPVQNASFAPIWGINAQTQQTAASYRSGAMVYNTLMGFAGSAALEIGGYDYHNGTRTQGDTKDGEAGEAIGRILQSAKTLGKPVFLYVTSDGAVTSPDSMARDAVWSSDRGSAGAAYIFMYHPNGRPAVSSNQIGHYTDGQAADDKFVTGNDPARAAQAVFANYLKYNNRLGEFEKIVGRNSISTADLNKVVKVA